MIINQLRLTYDVFTVNFRHCFKHEVSEHGTGCDKIPYFSSYFSPRICGTYHIVSYAILLTK